MDTEDAFQGEIIKQVELAVDEATSIIFMLTVAEGLTDTDIEIHEMLRRANKPFYIVVNKVDSAREELAATEFYQLGISKYYTMSATGSGTGELLDDIVKDFPTTDYKILFEGLPKITIAGRPNVWEIYIDQRSFRQGTKYCNRCCWNNPRFYPNFVQ